MRCTAIVLSAVLFGSQARGDAQEESDYDVAVFLKNMPDRWAEIDKIVEIGVGILDETGAGTYEERTPLMHKIRREGLDL